VRGLVTLLWLSVTDKSAGVRCAALEFAFERDCEFLTGQLENDNFT
jgi:hypothetical protein